MEHGVLFESVAVKVFTHLFPTFTHYDSALISNSKYPYFAASPDGFLIQKDLKSAEIIEIKCPSSKKSLSPVPEYYFDQMQFQMMITNITKCNYFSCRFECFTNRKLAKQLVSENKIVGIRFCPDIENNSPQKIFPYICGIDIQSYESMMKKFDDAYNTTDDTDSPATGPPEFFTLNEYFHEKLKMDRDWQRRFIEAFNTHYKP